MRQNHGRTMTPVAVAAILLATLAILGVVFLGSIRLFRAHPHDDLASALEVVKAVALLLVAGFTFAFIDQQRQTLSQAEYDFKVYQTFLEASNTGDINNKLRVLNNITTYRQNFLTPGSRLDNTLVALSKSLLDDREVQQALSAPDNGQIAIALANDRSAVLKGKVTTLEELLGPLEPLSEVEREKWAAANFVSIELPFPIQLGFAKPKVNHVRVHRRAAPFFVDVFRDIYAAGLRSSIRTLDGTSNVQLANKGKSWSAHVYGVAIDFNAATNELGTSGDMDPKLIAVFKRNGFIWGGDWTGQDQNPRHFELSTEALAGRVAAVRP